MERRSPSIWSNALKEINNLHQLANVDHDSPDRSLPSKTINIQISILLVFRR